MCLLQKKKDYCKIKLFFATKNKSTYQLKPNKMTQQLLTFGLIVISLGFFLMALLAYFLAKKVKEQRKELKCKNCKYVKK